MSLPPPRKLGVTSIVLLGVLTLSMVLFAIRRDRLLKPGQTIQFDDFFFTLENATRSEPIESKAANSPRGMVRYDLTLTVDNRAKRVPFRLGDQSLAIIDQRDGRRFYVSRRAQQAQEDASGVHRTDPLVLKAGESATRDYVFAVPSDVQAPRLRIAPGGWFGLAIDRVLTGLKEFELP